MDVFVFFTGFFQWELWTLLGRGLRKFWNLRRNSGFYPYTSVSEQETKVVSYAKLSDVQLQQQNDGQEVLAWLAVRGTKTPHGQERGHQKTFQPKIYATNTARCPVKFQKKFRSHRPVKMDAPESPFYFAALHN